jgi:hypothetical protein
MMPEIKPLKKGAPDAKAMPRQSGRATKKTTTPDGRSYFQYLKVNPLRSCITVRINN